MPHIAVMVPGIMGSELRLEDQLIWPGPVRSLVFPYRKMSELLREDLVATDVIRHYSVSPQYQTLIDDLALCGFREDDDPPTLVLCPYDWRKANELAADVLADRIDEAVQLHGGDAEVSIIAHSMGGLIGRHYLESGRFDGRPGWRAVRRLITLGTPHRGAAVALPRMLGREKVMWLSGEQVRQAASDPRYPAVYQLLPPVGEPFLWDDSPEADYQPVDVYNPDVARELGLVAENLEAARRFHASLDLARRPKFVRYFCFAGTRQTTLTVVRLDRSRGTYELQWQEAKAGGDGTVPHWSSILPGLQSLPVGGAHGTLYKNRDLRLTLVGLLGVPFALAETFAAQPGEVEVALRDPVTEPEALLHVTLTCVGGSRDLDGELRVEAVEMADDREEPLIRLVGAPHPIRYSGPAAEGLGLLLEAPALGGVYRVSYYHKGQARPAGSDDLFVQQSTDAVPPIAP